MTAPRWPMCGPPSARAPVNPHGEPAALAPGYALIRLDDLAALLHDRQAAPEVTPTWPGLAGAVSVVVLHDGRTSSLGFSCTTTVPATKSPSLRLC